MDIKLSEDVLKDALIAFIEDAVNKLNKEIRAGNYNSKCYVRFHADNSFKLTGYIPDNSWSLKPKMPVHYSYELYYDKDKGLLVLKLTDEYQEFLRYINDILPEAVHKSKKPDVAHTNMLKYFNDLEIHTIHSNYIKSLEYLIRS